MTKRDEFLAAVARADAAQGAKDVANREANTLLNDMAWSRFGRTARLDAEGRIRISETRGTAMDPEETITFARALLVMAGVEEPASEPAS